MITRWILGFTVALIAFARSASAFADADLSLTASATPEPVRVHSNLSYSLTVSNGGPDVASGVLISNELPASVNLISATGFYSLSNSVLLLNFASLAVGATVSAQVVVQPTVAGELTNLFQVASSLSDPVPANNAVTVVSTVTNTTTVVVPIPGTPVAGWNDPGGQLVMISEGGGIGAQPLTNSSGPLPVASGSVVLLSDPDGGTNYTNWKAVVDFYNPNDPTGTQILTATNYLTFFQTNADPDYFANFPLFTNVAFVPVDTTNADGSVTASIDIFGPVGGIPSGQETVITLTAAPQPPPGPPSVAISSPYAGQQFENVQGFAVFGSWSQSLSSQAPITGLSVSLNGGTPVNAILAIDYFDQPYFYTFEPLIPVPGSNTVSAAIVDSLGNAATNSVTFYYQPFAPGTNTLGIPGTPATTWPNPIVLNTNYQTISLLEGGGIGVQGTSILGLGTTVEAGDVVMLINPDNGDSPTNWEAVVQFFNPADPTGTNGLAATEYQTWFQTNAGPLYFDHFALMRTNVIYVPVASVNSDGSITADINVYGPVGGIFTNQLCILKITAAIQPDPFALNITSPAGGQEVGNALLTVTGTTSSNLVSVSEVLVQLNGGNWTAATTANGWANWSESVSPVSGLNTLQAYAVDDRGNVTTTNTVTFDYVTDASEVADLSLSGSAGPLSGTFGTNLVYSLTVSNAGPSIATGVEVIGRISPDSGFISATGGATPTNGDLVVNLGTLAVGATNLVQINLEPDNGSGTLSNGFQVFANQTDPNLANNSAIIASSLFPSNYVGQYSESTAEYDTVFTTNVSQQVTNDQTELIARLSNGTVVYDQTFAAPYSDPTVQTAVAQATADVSAAGATSVTGPIETSNTQALVGGSLVTVPNGTNVNFVVGTMFWSGPETILVGNFGVVQGYTFDPVATNFAYPIGWNGTPITLTLCNGFFDVETMLLSLVDIYQTTTDTTNYLNSAVYTITGGSALRFTTFNQLTNAAIFNGVGGQDNSNYVVLSSTNLLLPITAWTPVSTNSFDGTGQFHYTNTSPTKPRQFFILKSP